MKTVSLLAEKFPDRVKKLAAKWVTIAARADVLPLGAWHGKQTPKESSVRDAVVGNQGGSNSR
jgi:hypothetical protein